MDAARGAEVQVQDAAEAEIQDSGFAWQADASPAALPTVSAPLACSPTWPELATHFVAPAIAPPTGAVQLATGKGLFALGPWSRLPVTIVTPAGTPDTQAAGEVTVTSDPGVEVAWVEPAKGGQSAATLRLTSTGLHQVSLALADGRTGKAEIFGYSSALSVAELTMDPGDWDDMIGHPYATKEYPCSLVMEGKQHAGATIKLHGGTSGDAPKRSFRVDLKKSDGLSDGRTKLVFRSEYIDKTMLRTWLSYELVRQLTWLPAPTLEFVHFRVNQRYYGVMGLVERVDAHYLTARGRNPKGTLYEADPPNQLAVPGGNLTTLFPATTYPLVYAKHSGPTAYDDLRALIEETLLLPDKTFRNEIESVVKVGDWLEFAAVMAVIQNQEHIRKNFYLFRDHDGPDQRWEFMVWDFDMTWGHLWTEIGDAMDETIFADLEPEKGHKSVDSKFFNQMYRVLDNPTWKSQWKAEVLRIAKVGLTPAFYQPRIAAQLCRMGPDVLADSLKRSSDAEYIKRVAELDEYATARLSLLVARLGQP